MARFRDDVEGCGCLRCQGLAIDVSRRSLPAVFAWSARLPVERPSIAVAFLAVGLGQVALLATSGTDVLPATAFGLLGAFLGRGYVAVVGRAALGQQRRSPAAALRVLGRRLPAFLAASALAFLLILAFVVLVVDGLADPVRAALRTLGASRVAADVAVLLGLAGGTVYLLTKLWFVPEACLVGGYRPVASLRTSWAVASLHRAKALALVTGFAALLALGVLFDTHLSDPRSPLALSLTYRGTTVVLRSFGLSAAGGFRLGFDLLLAAVYSGVFVHHYVASVVER